MEPQSHGVLDTSLALARGMTAHLEQRGRAFARPGGGLLPARRRSANQALGGTNEPVRRPGVELVILETKDGATNMSGSHVTRAGFAVAGIAVPARQRQSSRGLFSLCSYGRFMVGRRRAEHNGWRAGAAALPGNLRCRQQWRPASTESEMRKRKL
jgi:hypothetical protein